MFNPSSKSTHRPWVFVGFDLHAPGHHVDTPLGYSTQGTLVQAGSLAQAHPQQCQHHQLHCEYRYLSRVVLWPAQLYITKSILNQLNQLTLLLVVFHNSFQTRDPSSDQQLETGTSTAVPKSRINFEYFVFWWVISLIALYFFSQGISWPAELYVCKINTESAEFSFGRLS